MHNTSYVKLLVTPLKVVLLAGALIAGLLLYGFMQYSNRPTNLIQNESWLHFPGAKVTDTSIHFTPLHRIIIHQDGSLGQPNPPVNIGGSHLKFIEDFSDQSGVFAKADNSRDSQIGQTSGWKITAIVSNIDKQASFRLYATPPIVYDQWRYESPSIEITIDEIKNLITARIWDGSSNYSMDTRTYEISINYQTKISIEHIRNQITIIANNRVLGSMPDHHIFDSGTIWFGANGVTKSTGWTLALLTAETIGTGRIEMVSAPSFIVDHNNKNSLRNLINANSKKIKIGAAVALGPLVTDQQYRALALGQFSTLTPENSMKPQFIHPEANVYDFAEADQTVDAALKNDIIIHGHVLLYDKSSPEWMVKTPKEDRQKVMVSHIENVVGHFKGRVAEWDVVNEPFSKKNALYKNGKSGLEPNFWFEAMGEEYIDLAFRAARKADPSAKLYLNDYGVENDGQHWDALLALVKRLKQRGVPIDGVGFEAHIYTDGDYIKADQLKKHMEILAGLNLLTRISEIDVTGDDAQEQINQYVTVLDICLRTPNCTSYTTWGITDLYGSTTRSDRYPLVHGTSLLWDKDMKAKPAYGALQKRLQQPY